MAPPEALIELWGQFLDPSANDVCGAFQSTLTGLPWQERPAKPGSSHLGV